MNVLKICLLLTAAAIFIAACSQGPTTTTNAPKNTANISTPAQSQPPTPADEIAKAKELYATNCMICHKDSGKGGKVTIEGKSLEPVDLTSAKLKARTDDKLIKQIVEGVPDEGMPAFKGKLTENEIKQVVSHIRSLQGR